jgi:hypothetical protein
MILAASDYARRSPFGFAVLMYVLSFFVALPFSNHLLNAWLITPHRVYDHNIYMNIALDGYHSPADPAFYPLWPWVLGLFSSLPTHYFTVFSNFLALLCFVITLKIFELTLKKLDLRTWAIAWALAAFALNPNSVFHAIGYPESFFSLLAVTCIFFSLDWILEKSIRSFGISLGISFALGLTRPIFLQFSLAALITAIATIFMRSDHKPQGMARRFTLFAGGAIVACATGYVPFGVMCWQRFQNFWQPFDAQSYWDRNPGLNWSLFTQPKSVGGSDNVLTWDLQSFYLPVFLVVFFMLAIKSRKLMPQQALIIGLFSSLIAAAHGGIAFITYPIFMSIGRHVFSTPFFFIAAAIFINSSCKNSIAKRLAITWVAVEFFYLIHFWTRFARIAWIG